MRRVGLYSVEEKINSLGEFGPTHKSHYDLNLALLFPALLKVERLVLDLDTGWNTNYLEQMIRSAGCREKPFDIQPKHSFIHTTSSIHGAQVSLLRS